MPWDTYRKHHPDEAAKLDQQLAEERAAYVVIPEPVNDAPDLSTEPIETDASIILATPGATENSRPWLAPPFERGVSGNPGGRPGGTLGFAKAIQRATHNGETLWKIALQIAENGHARNRDRLDAIAWLADRGFGKALDISHLLNDDDVERIARANGVDPERVKAHIKQLGEQRSR